MNNVELKAWRNLYGISQPKMADFLGVSLSMYSRWECGRKPPETLDEIKNLADVLNMVIDTPVYEINKIEQTDVTGWQAKLQMDTKQMARLLGCRVSTVKRWGKPGTWPPGPVICYLSLLHLAYHLDPDLGVWPVVFAMVAAADKRKRELESTDARAAWED